jgi:hypothetical protein
MIELSFVLMYYFYSWSADIKCFDYRNIIVLRVFILRNNITNRKTMSSSALSFKEVPYACHAILTVCLEFVLSSDNSTVILVSTIHNTTTRISLFCLEMC